MRTSWFLFVLAVFSSLLATVDGSVSGVLDLKLEPERPNNLYYSLRGSVFVLNCTIAVGNVQALTWQYNGKWLDHEVEQVDSSTVQLKLSNTSRINNGFYWCGPKFGNTSRGVNISLTVADLPSPPRNLRYSVVGLLGSDREYRVFWLASSFTGGLPVNYSMKLCLNDSRENRNVCKWNFSDPDCRAANVLRTDKDFRCVLKKPGDFIRPCLKECNYTISVVAKNPVGSSTSWQYMPRVQSYSATPLPPLNFMVVATDIQKELRVTWGERNAWKFTETEYTILYHAKNDMENETKVVQNKTGYALLRSLEAFMEYYVYLMVRFVSIGAKKSAPSEVQGPRIVKTPAGEPDTPSKVIRHRSVIFPGDPALRNVTVEWELADNASWRGTPGKYVVVCKHYLHTLGSLPNCKYHVDATSNRTVLQRLDSAKSYLVYIKMCNKERMCSPDGESYIIKEIQVNSTTPTNGGQLSSKQIALITVSVVVGCTTALFAIYVIRKWRQGRIHEILHLVNLRDRISLPPPVPANYDYVDPLVTNEYDYLNQNEV